MLDISFIIDKILIIDKEKGVSKVSIRDQNKHKRRQQILAAARQILVEGGYDSLTTRGLAKHAGLTVPTIYNLIGGKDEVLEALMADSVERTWAELEFPPVSPGLERADYFIDLCTRRLERDDGSIRATVIASDRVTGAYSVTGSTALRYSNAGLRSVEMATDTVAGLQQGGALLGNIPAPALGEQIFVCFRDTVRDWGYGLISASEFRRRYSRGIYMLLCSDATETVRRELVKRINSLETDTGSAVVQAASGR